MSAVMGLLGVREIRDLPVDDLRKRGVRGAPDQMSAGLHLLSFLAMRALERDLEVNTRLNNASATKPTRNYWFPTQNVHGYISLVDLMSILHPFQKGSNSPKNPVIDSKIKYCSLKVYRIKRVCYFRKSTMIVKELASIFKLQQDHTFSIHIQLILVQQLLQRQKTDVRARALLEEIMSSSNGVGAQSFAFYLKEEAFIRSHMRLEDFFRKGNPSLGSFVAKPKDVDLTARTMRTVPAFVAEWNASSRRVFQLGAETQRLLEETNYGELERDDVVIPFPSFIVRLAEGIPYEGHVVTAIGFSEERVIAESLSLPFPAWGYVLMRECCLWDPLTEREKEKFLKDALKSKKCIENMQRIGSRMERIWDEGNYAPLIRISNSEKLFHKAEQVAGSLPNDFKSYTRIHSIMVNLMAVLSRMTKRSSGAHPLKNCDKGDVSSTENVFDIGSISTLGDVIDSKKSAKNRTSSEDGKTITPHWRRRHERRHPGMGHIPDAPKDVKVPATLVLGNFLAPGTLPVGSSTKI